MNWHRTKQPSINSATTQSSLGLLPSTLALVLTMSGCAMAPNPYYESYELKHLTVVFLDEKTLHERWRKLTSQQPVSFRAFSGSGHNPTIRTVRGFFDFRTNTIYCNKMDFAVCGHELHHAVLGQFTPHH